MGLKKKIHIDARRPTGYKEREVWWAYLGENVGSEEDGKGRQFSRPILILRGFSRDLFWGVPLSTTTKRGQYYHELQLNEKTSVALISQIRTLDTSRLIRKYGFISKKDFLDINTKTRKLLSDGKR